MKLYFPFKIPEVSEEKQKMLAIHLFNENIQRCKLFAKIVILFESILIIINLTPIVTANNSIIVVNEYLILYLILLLSSVAMLVYIHLFEKKSPYTERQFKMLHFGLLSFVSYFIVWGAVVTLFDQKGYGHVMAFAVNFMCVSILFHASNTTILKLYSLPVAVLGIGLPFFQSSNSVLFGHYTNLVVFIFFCWLASRMLYISNATNFFNKLLLTETNENLELEIKENENINIKLAKANEQLKQLTLIDELTKIPNRRGFQQYVSEKLKPHHENQKLSIMMLDIDCFKPFNDFYGHLNGDKVIESVAQKINACIDFPDSIVARFGGEEFVIAIFHLDNPAVFQAAEEIRRAIYEMKIPHDYSAVSNYVTVSIGVDSDYVRSEHDLEKRLENADKALYKAKELGRNKVEKFEH